MIAGTLTSAGVKVNLLSNGKTWSRSLALRAKAFGLESVAFSIDGCEVTHDYIRRTPGQRAHLLRMIDLTIEAGMKVGIVTQINRENLDELEDLRETLAEHGVSSWQLQLGNPTGNMADHREMVLRPEDVLDIVPRVAALRQMPGPPRIFVGDNIGYYGEYEQILRDQGRVVPFWVGCRAGCTVMGIESNGNIKGCLSLPSEVNGVDRFVEGNIRERPLREIWEDPNAFAYNRQFKVEQLQGFCRTCDYADICRGGCSWTSFSHTGDERGGNPYCYHRQLEERKAAQGRS